jgi:predicted N-formylglutamate amidohydrolase
MYLKNDDLPALVPTVAEAAIQENNSYELIAGSTGTKIIFLCDHASNFIPDELESLGLEQHIFERHIAYDIGVAELTRGLAAHFDAPAVLSQFSRLLIDPNRGLDDPTLIMRLSDGAVIPRNSQLDDSERQDRLQRFYHPYHLAITAVIDQALAEGNIPVLISIHSFTQAWKGIPRPWHAGILWDKDPRLAQPLIEALADQGDIVVGNNQPYSGALYGDCLHRHGTGRGLAHGLVEVRQDLIGDSAGIKDWLERLVRSIETTMGAKDLHKIIHYGSHSV